MTISCNSAINGDMPLVVELSQPAGSCVLRSGSSPETTIDANAMDTGSSSQLSTTSQNSTTVGDVVPGNAYPAQTKLKAAYAYGIRPSDRIYILWHHVDHFDIQSIREKSHCVKTTFWPSQIGMDLNTVASNQGPQGLDNVSLNLAQEAEFTRANGPLIQPGLLLAVSCEEEGCCRILG